ncbi:hypothetical protein EMIT07CA2_270011 [Brevibacillus sp. IT-7CA2]
MYKRAGHALQTADKDAANKIGNVVYTPSAIKTNAHKIKRRLEIAASFIVVDRLFSNNFAPKVYTPPCTIILVPLYCNKKL